MPIIYEPDDPNNQEITSVPRTDDTNRQLREQELMERAQEVHEPTPTMMQKITNSFILENPIASAIKFGPRNVPNFAPRPDDDFNGPREVQGTKYEQFIDQFITADSTEEVEKLKKRIDAEQESRSIAAKSGALGIMGALAGGILDPTMILPGVRGVKAVTALSRTGRRAQRLTNIRKGAVSGTAFASGAVAAQEGVLQDTQLFRTAGESLSAVVYAGAIGATLGGLIGGITRKALTNQGAKFMKDVDNESLGTHKIGGDSPGYTGGSAGSASVRDLDKDLFQEGISFNNPDSLEKLYSLKLQVDNLRPGSPEYTSANKAFKAQKKKIDRSQKIGEEVFKTMSGARMEYFQSPSLRGLVSPAPSIRKLTNEIFEHPFETGRTVAGETVNPAFSRIEIEYANILKIERSASALWLSQAGLKSKPGLARTAVGDLKAKLDDDVLSKQDFGKSVGRAMYNKDIDSIPEVAKAASEFRKGMSEVVKEAQKRGILPEQLKVKGADSYFPQKWKADEILNNRDEFIRKLQVHFMKGDSNNKPVKDPDRALELADDTTRKLLREDEASFGIPEASGASGKGFTKERKLLVDPTEFSKYLDQDAFRVIPGYIVKLRRLIETYDVLQKFNADSIPQFLSKLSEEFNQLIKANPSDANKLTRQKRSQEVLAKHILEILEGNLKRTVSGEKIPLALRVLRTLQTTRLLGGVFLTSLVEFGMAPFRLGLFRTVIDGYVPFIRNFKAARMTGDQLNDFGLALQLQMNNTLRTVQEGEKTFFGTAKTGDRASEFFTQLFGKVSGISLITVVGRRIAGQVVSAHILRTLGGWAKTGKISAKDKRILGRRGIGISEYKRISDQFKKYGEQHDGSFLSNHHLWDDKEVAEIYGRAVVREVDNVILDPNPSDILIGQQKNDLVKNLLQFRSFSQAATNRILLSGIQRLSKGELGIPVKFTSLIMMGYLVYAVKEMNKKREPKTDIRTVLLEGVTRSGVLGLMGDYVMALNPYGRASRFGDRSIVDTLTGATFGHGVDTIKAVQQTAKGNFNPRSYIRLLPFQNLFYLNALNARLSKPNKKRKRKKK